MSVYIMIGCIFFWLLVLTVCFIVVIDFGDGPDPSSPTVGKNSRRISSEQLGEITPEGVEAFLNRFGDGYVQNDISGIIQRELEESRNKCTFKREFFPEGWSVVNIEEITGCLSEKIILYMSERFLNRKDSE